MYTIVRMATKVKGRLYLIFNYFKCLVNKSLHQEMKWTKVSAKKEVREYPSIP